MEKTPEEYPEWKAPDFSGPQYIEPALDDPEVYQTLLDEDQIKVLSEKCDEDILLRLLNDASETPRINALKVIQYRHNASASATSLVHIWMKSSSCDLSAAALEAYLEIEPDFPKAIEGLIDAILLTDSDAVKMQFVGMVLKNQKYINGIIDAYYKRPKRCANFILKFLKSDPSEETKKRILYGLDRSQSPECVCETVQCLLNARANFDSPKLRATLISLVKDPVSFGHYGIISRVNSLKLLKLMISKDDPKNEDTKTVKGLLDIHQHVPNNELKDMAKLLLKFMGEEDLVKDEEESWD